MNNYLGMDDKQWFTGIGKQSPEERKTKPKESLESQAKGTHGEKLRLVSLS